MPATQSSSSSSARASSSYPASVTASMSGVLKAQSFHLIWCAAAVSIVTCADPTNERKSVSALIVDRAAVMGGRVVVPLYGRGLSVRLLPPSSRDVRRHVLTLALGDVKISKIGGGSKKLRLRASSEREYRQWTSALVSALQTEVVDVKHMDEKNCAFGNVNENENGMDKDKDPPTATPIDTSMHLSRCETVETSSSTCMTSRSSCCSRESLTSLSRDDVDEAVDTDEATAAVTDEIEDGASTVNSTVNSSTNISMVERITSAVASCEASESWRGSSSRQQLARSAIREVSRVGHWDAPTLMKALHLEVKCEDISGGRVQQQQSVSLEHENKDEADASASASAVCEMLSSALGTSVYIMTTSPSTFLTYDAKQCVLRKCSGIEWLSALTGDLVASRRCPVVLRSRSLDLSSVSGCSLLRFADVALTLSSSASSTSSSSLLPVVAEEIADEDEDEDDDSEGVWV